MKTKVCKACGERKREEEFPSLSHKRMALCFNCAIDEIRTQRKTGREGAAPRFRICRHCRKRRRIERYPARTTNSGICYRSYSCSRCCDAGLEWQPSKMVKKVMEAKWLNERDDSAEERDPWIEKLARSIAMDREKSGEE